MAFKVFFSINWACKQMNLKMNKTGWKLQKQRGFTVVDIAGVIVGAGLALGIAVQGADVVSSARYAQFYDELQVMETQLWTFYEKQGRWPGDCNSDGVMGFQPVNAVDSVVDFKPVQRGCKAESLLTALQDLKAKGVIAADIDNGEVLMHEFGHFFQLGHTFSPTNSALKSNVIVAYGIPQHVAAKLDLEIDGVENGMQGRLRRWDEQGMGTAWPNAEADDSSLVALAYFFESKIP